MRMRHVRSLHTYTLCTPTFRRIYYAGAISEVAQGLQWLTADQALLGARVPFAIVKTMFAKTPTLLCDISHG